MLRPKIIRIAALVSISLCGTAVRARVPFEEIAPRPRQVSQEKMAALVSLSTEATLQQDASPRRAHRYFFRKLRHPLTPADVSLRESVRSLGTDPHHFVLCDLKNGSEVTGAIGSIGEEGFYVKTGILGSGHSISYRDLAAAPRPVAAVGTHLKNGAEWAGFVALGIALAPFFLVLGMTGVIQD
ncbi:MAG TPA: hypothetical protein VJN92_24085 [Candidatus Acidoferrum sp.]|nr:hypothetical protein [Candidatus Acidoferrum sp.]